MPFAVERSTEISFRTDFALLADARGYKDAVEVGVDLGVFAREFLARWHGYWLFLIDPYEPYPERPYERMVDFYVAAQAMAPFHGRFRFIRAPSPEAVPLVRTFIKPEFVYIDASHEEADVAADLRAWWEILPPHGMLAGHDYDSGHPGVMVAVEKFARELGVVVRITHERDSPPSWYVYRREPEKLISKFFNDGESANPHATKGQSNA